MPVRRRSNAGRSWLVDLTVNGTRRFKTLPGHLSKREVLAWEREWRSRLETGAPHSTATVRHILDRYWDEKACRLANRRTIRCYLGMWGEALGTETPATQVQAKHIAAIIARWRGPIVDATVNRRADALRGAWHYAAEVLGVPVAQIPWRRLRLSEPEPPDRSLSADLRSALLAAWPSRSVSVAGLALSTGLRLSAALRLERRDLDFSRGIIHTVTKGRGGGKPVVAPMSAQARAVLEGMTLPEVGRIFQVTERQVRADREVARKAAGLPGFRFHDFRHTFCQILEDAGFGDAIPDAVHHSSYAMRRRYAHARVDKTRAIIDEAWRRENGRPTSYDGDGDAERMPRVVKQDQARG